MKYLIFHTDKGKLWRTSEDAVTHVWQPLESKATEYDANDAIDVMRLANGLDIGETIGIKRIR